MFLKRIFATAMETPLNDRWAIWSLVHDYDGLIACNEVEWFVKTWQNRDYIEQELKRIMKLPASYVTPNRPLVRQVLKESDQLAQLIYPAQLIINRSRYCMNKVENHLLQMTRIWSTFENIANLSDLRLKGKAKKLETDFLRIYAICVRPNVYIITGSALKGTPEKLGEPIIDPKIEVQFQRLNFVLSKLKEQFLDDNPEPYFERAFISLD